jgi:hypothetical protein
MDALIRPDRLRRLARAVGLGIVAVLAAGCAGVPTVTGEVTRFHRWENAEPRTFAFRTDAQRAGSLEYASYEAHLRERLVALGFSPVSPAEARYQLSLDFSAAAEPRRVIDAWGASPFGPYPLRVGPGFPAYRRYDPWWSLPPVPIVTDLTVWRHDVRLDVWDVRIGPAGGSKVFEATASAVAGVEALPRLVPALVDALLAGFPGPSGVTQHIEVPLPPRRD